MGRPFRSTPPTLRIEAIERRRLIERLERRWSCRLVTVTAGPGFGKTTLLASVIASSGDRERVDVWLSCEPADEDADYLLAGLADALGVAGVTQPDDLARAIWARAPVQVCFVLDDVHEIPEGSPGAELLARLVVDAPRNTSFVLSSRAAPPAPVPLIRLAAAGAVHTIGETDLTFTAAELDVFAAVRHADRDVIHDGARWPALAELAVVAGDDSFGHDMVADYVWDVVLTAVGPQLARQFALLVTVGGADQEVADAVVGGPCDLTALADAVPLVERRGSWIVPHRLWEPAARRLVDAGERRTARIAAARVHARHGRFERAVELFSDADAWDELQAMIREVAVSHGALEQWHRIGAWRHRLPPEMRIGPAARLAEAMSVASRVPLDAVTSFRAAADGFRAGGDADGELAALERLGIVLWWAGDVGGLWELYQRAVELRDAGVERALVVTRVGEAAIAHLSGDPAGVLAALEPLGSAATSVWARGICWFRHVAHRRRGDLERAELVLEEMGRLPGAAGDPQLALARLRTEWLLGHVDGVAAGLYEAAERYAPEGQRYLRTEAALEAAARYAWLGDRRSATRILDEVTPRLDVAPGPLVRVLRAITEAALAVDRGDEPTARRVLAKCDVARPGAADSWFWCDRCAVALVHQLRVEDRDGWVVDAAAPVHRLGLHLSEVLSAVRAGDLGPVAELVWPAAGLVRAHLPARWVRDLVDAAEAAGNPAPFELLDAVSATPTRPATTVAAATASSSPPDAGVLEVLVLGPLTVRRDGVEVDGPELRRARVRELLSLLTVEPVQRRDAVADVMWPDHHDPRHNLRVTLSYLRHVFQLGDDSERPARDAEPTGNATPVDGGLRADASTVRLVPGSSLRCDLWQFDSHLRAAGAFERAGDPPNALDAYAAALALWRGVPFAESDLERLVAASRALTGEFVRAAVRAGELWLAAGDVDDALRAGQAALAVDPVVEAAHRLVVRAHVAAGDRVRARDAFGACLAALADIGVIPDGSTAALASTVGDGRR